ncbi:hypothetical protein Tco_1151048 [Tanacetum coccineum]
MMDEYMVSSQITKSISVSQSKFCGKVTRSFISSLLQPSGTGFCLFALTPLSLSEDISSYFQNLHHLPAPIQVVTNRHLSPRAIGSCHREKVRKMEFGTRFCMAPEFSGVVSNSQNSCHRASFSEEEKKKAMASAAERPWHEPWSGEP